MAIDMIADYGGKHFVKHNKDGSMTFLSDDFDNFKRMK